MTAPVHTVRASAAEHVPTDDFAIADSVVSVGMTVSDLDRSVRFYHDVLTFKKVGEAEIAGETLEHVEGVFGARVRTARMRLGGETLELTEYLAPRGKPIPVESRSNDRWFQHVAIIVRDMDQAYARLREHRVQHASSGPQTLPEWNRNAAGIQAFYFKDPDGHALEVLAFPPGKGDPKWHAPGDALFLGIDHTAIVVGDTQKSLAFYRDTLGLRVAGESENYGTEQEHLNNVFGARLRITSMRARSGPGIEFLEYLAPSDGRPYPSDTRANDIVHWETTLVTSDIDRLARHLAFEHAPFASPGVVSSADLVFGFRKEASIQDPDGHVLHLIQR
jgi:catechol 2,3-dioxygenase-like lactoylglutathione lyase family enzyme